MPRLAPVVWRELVRRLRLLGFEGPFQGGKHPYEEVDVTEPVLIELMGRYTTEEALVLGDEVLIGQTVLEKTDLHVDCRERRLLPNPAHPDQPVLKVKWLWE